MKGSEFVFNYLHLMYYKCHKINPNHGGLYADSPNWIKNKKATINLINKKDKNAVTVALNYEETRKHEREKIANIVKLEIIVIIQGNIEELPVVYVI